MRSVEALYQVYYGAYYTAESENKDGKDSDMVAIDAVRAAVLDDLKAETERFDWSVVEYPDGRTDTVDGWLERMKDAK